MHHFLTYTPTTTRRESKSILLKPTLLLLLHNYPIFESLTLCTSSSPPPALSPSQSMSIQKYLSACSSWSNNVSFQLFSYLILPTLWSNITHHNPSIFSLRLLPFNHYPVSFLFFLVKIILSCYFILHTAKHNRRSVEGFLVYEFVGHSNNACDRSFFPSYSNQYCHELNLAINKPSCAVYRIYPNT